MATHNFESYREEYSEQLTIAKNLTINILHEHGIIDDDQAQHYSKNFAIIVSKPSLFSKLFGKGERMIMVEQHSLKEEENKDE